MAKKDDEAGKLTTAEQVAAWLDKLVINHTITADVAGILKHQIAAEFGE
jgi:hypothetical protein